MALEGGRLAERSVTVPAPVGSLPSVDACMCPEAALREEDPLTFLTVP